jgi:hypothetical protein
MVSFALSADHMVPASLIAFANLLVDAVHGMGLIAGQEITFELGRRGRDEIGFDFAVARECFRWSECASYSNGWGD